jgi:chemotaxis protein CheC
MADILLGQPRGTADAWLEMETSAALETTNIVCCAYLNALSRILPRADDGSSEFIPSPPRFSRDFAESLIESALMGQIIATDHVLLARTQFHIDGTPIDWTLLFVPDADSMTVLRGVLH